MAGGHDPIVKICGTRTVESAELAVAVGANLIGIICVPNAKRTVDPEIARQISCVVRTELGVFRNQPLEEVLQIQKDYKIDIVQLHGSEPITWASEIPVPVMKKFSPGDDNVMSPGFHALTLFDGGEGGEGVQIDWNDEQLPKEGKFMLAGGLTPENVAQAVKVNNVIGVDVSTGVETDGKHDLEKIRSFIINAKSLN
ncbi:N-anthranilate isomerase [Lipomyces oligophaga]|uniref:N-anthranilate isomerase n=1 Tax=Lipomyces oligophaga TaxID=45792 RepID=UPI0034CE73EB